MGRKVPADTVVTLDQVGLQVFPDIQDTQDHKAQVGIADIRAHKEHQDIVVILDHKAQVDIVATLVRKEPLGTVATHRYQVIRVIAVPKEHLVTVDIPQQ